MCDGVSQRVRVCPSVGGCVSVCEGVSQCVRVVPVWDGVSQCVRLCLSV